MKKNTMYRWLLLLEQITLGIVLVVLLQWHLKVGLVRFFDVDEFTHLHWAANMAHGQKPYIDFFTFFTPGFYWLLAPLFWIFGKSTALFIAARWSAFIVFSGIVAVTGLLFRLIRPGRYAILSMVILAFLPMPYDKFMELRPDNTATLLGLTAVLLQIFVMLRPKYPRPGLLWFASGFCYAASLIVLVKTLPFVVAGTGVAAYYWWQNRKNKAAIRHVILFIAGAGIPSGLFFLWLLSLGDFSRVVYALTKLAFEANTIGQVYIMEPHLFFFPNASFYGGWGITRALLTNHTIWTIGILMGCYRLFTPLITGDGDKNKVLAEVLTGCIFIFSVVGYVMFFPLKHSQYLIPIAVFIAIYAADFLGIIAGKLGLFGSVCIAAIAVFLAVQNSAVNTPKLSMANTVQMEQTTALLRLIPEDSQVLDLDGRLLFWKDPYEICCLPFGSFVRFLSRPPEKLSNVLEAKKVPYIYQGTSGRLWELWDDLPYIKSHYETVSGWGDALWERKKSE